MELLQPVTSEWDATIRLSIAALIGLGVGLEREWSGHTTGPGARFAGLRTLFLLGLLGGVGGVLLANGFPAAGAVLLAGGSALAVAAYVITARRAESEVDGTTEAAALAVVGLGAIAGAGWLALAAGAGSVIVLVLREKKRLHWVVRKFSEHELRAMLQFAVLALVVLPLLPKGPFWGVLDVRPRGIWTLVLFFSALNFAGFLARRAVGVGAGYTITGMLGGVISSTAVTLDFARKSRDAGGMAGPLATGVIGACTIMLSRVAIASTVLNPAAGSRAALLFVPPALVGAGWVLVALRREQDVTHDEPPGTESPLRLRVAVPMAVAFQLGVVAIALAQQWWGQMSLYPTAAVLGLTDMDALTVSVSRAGGVPADVAARALAIGVLANTALKAGVAASVGTGHFRARAVGGLAALGAASAVGIILSML